MTPRQQRMLDAIRECLLREAAWAELHELGDSVQVLAAEERYCEERSRTLVGVIEEVLREEAEERVPAPDPIPQAGCTCLACEQLRDYQRRGIANAWRRRDAADAAVRALLDVSTRCVQESDAHQREYAAAADAVRRFFPEGGQ